MIIVLGTVTADLFIFSPEPFAGRGDDGFRASNLVFTDRPPTLLMGGNGGNSAYVLASLGAPTALWSAVGRDLLGDQLMSWLAARGVNLAGVLRCHDHATSASTIVMADAANQFVFHHLGASAQVCVPETASTDLGGACALLCTGYPLMSRLRAGGLVPALATARGSGILTALDVGPAIGEPVTLAELEPLLPHVDVLIGNAHELSLLTGERDLPAAVARLLAAGACHVVAKQGKKGASLHGRDGQIARAPAYAVDAHISVGAGDAFNAGFVYGLCQGWPAVEALRMGNAVAALVVSSARGVLGAPDRAAVDRFLSLEDTQPRPDGF